MTLASNKVQVGSKVSFAGYISNWKTQYPDPKKVEAVTHFPLPTKQREVHLERVLATSLCRRRMKISLKQEPRQRTEDQER